jgi:NMD protein affecting ribosome stability and mRNA decay
MNCTECGQEVASGFWPYFQSLCAKCFQVYLARTLERQQ